MESVVREQVGERAFEHWFAGRTRFAAQGDRLLVAVASPFLLSWMQKHFRRSLHEAAVVLLGPSGEAEFEVDSSLTAQATKEQPKISKAATKPSPDTASETSAEVSGDSTVLTGRRRFADLSDFVTGPSNELAALAARQVARAPGQKHNPLFIHGAAGTGKTHLLEGIYREIRRRYPGSQVLYLTCEAFTNYFTHAQRERSMPGFRQRFRNVDVLLLDDIDFLDAKRATQEEFLHTLTQLQSHGRQIVVSADSHPRLLSRLRDELTTRFMAGLVCRLEAPDFETRCAFLERKAAALPGKFTSDALAFVARRFTANMRELEGALNCLDTHYALTGRRVTLTVAREALGELERDCMRIISIGDIEGVVCRTFGVSTRDLRSSSRARSVSRPRMLAMYLARRHTQAAYKEIGQYFGNRNHSTVMAAERKVAAWLDEQQEIQLASRSWSMSDLIAVLEEQLLAG